MAVADVLDDSSDVLSGGSGLSPFTPFQALLRTRAEDRNGRVAGFGGGPVGFENGVAINRPGAAPRTGPLNGVPFVAFALAAYSGISAGSLALAARRLAVPRST